MFILYYLLPLYYYSKNWSCSWTTTKMLPVSLHVTEKNIVTLFAKMLKTGMHETPLKLNYTSSNGVDGKHILQQLILASWKKHICMLHLLCSQLFCMNWKSELMKHFSHILFKYYPAQSETLAVFAETELKKESISRNLKKVNFTFLITFAAGTEWSVAFWISTSIKHYLQRKNSSRSDMPLCLS